MADRNAHRPRPSAARRRRPKPRPRPRPRRPETRSGLRWSVALGLIALAFWLGRLTAPEAAESFSQTPDLTPDAGSSELASAMTTTSTIGLCPCPKPRRPRMRPLKKKPIPPRPPPITLRDPTLDTAAYLKKEARRLTPCAPRSGQPVRIHLEVTVKPSGEIQTVAVNNFEPSPPGVVRCVVDRMRALKPPGFDGTVPETFGLTVRL